MPGGFHLTSTARERIWATASGKANFLVFDGLGEDPAEDDPDALWLTTVRSHDQYNTTLYSLSDRYRGVHGQRDVLFINPREIEKRGLKHGDRVDLFTLSTDGIERVVRNFLLVPYAFPDGSCAAYYPETNPLVPLYAHDPICFTPSSKAIPIRIVRSRACGGGRLTMDAVQLARLQFAFTIGFHILWPTFTIGLASFIALLSGLWWRTGRTVYRDLMRFWLRIFALAFGMGVVTGVVSELRDRHQLGRLLPIGRERARPALHVRGIDRVLSRGRVHRHRALRGQSGSAKACTSSPVAWWRSARCSAPPGSSLRTAGCRRPPERSWMPGRLSHGQLVAGDLHIHPFPTVWRIWSARAF